MVKKVVQQTMNMLKNKNFFAARWNWGAFPILMQFKKWGHESTCGEIGCMFDNIFKRDHRKEVQRQNFRIPKDWRDKFLDWKRQSNVRWLKQNK